MTREVKEFLTDIPKKPEVQDALEARLLGGDTAALFKAVEKVHGRPGQTLDVSHGEFKMIQWPVGDDISEE